MSSAVTGQSNVNQMDQEMETTCENSCRLHESAGADSWSPHQTTSKAKDCTDQTQLADEGCVKSVSKHQPLHVTAVKTKLDS